MTRNIALIILDTVRKDYFDQFAPRIQQLADTTFDQCRAASSWSTPSHASMFTGDLPHEHGVHSRQLSFEPISPADTFLESLPEHSTLGVTEHGLISAKNGFDRFFDEYRQPGSVAAIVDRIEPGNGLQTYLAFLLETLKLKSPYTIAKTIDKGVWKEFGEQLTKLPIPKLTDDGANLVSNIALKEVSGADRPFFLFMNYMDAHRPYRVLRQYDSTLHSVPNTWSDGTLSNWEFEHATQGDSDYAKNYRELYSASINYLDKKVSNLITSIQSETDQETTFIITSDHGQNLGLEHEGHLFNHNSSMSEGVLHVPFVIVNPPKGFPQTVTEYFSHLQLGNLVQKIENDDSDVRELTGGPIPAELIGRPSGDNERPEFPGSDEEWEYWDRMIRVIYDCELKHEWDSLGNDQMYQLDADKSSWQEPIDTESDPEVDADNFFTTPITDYKGQVGLSEFESGVEDRLKELGYL